jgi:hypothetical protein
MGGKGGGVNAEVKSVLRIGIVLMDVDPDPDPDPDWHQHNTDPNADPTSSFTHI